MSDLDTQLRDYFEHVVERLAPTDVNRIGTASAAHELIEVRLIEDEPSVDDSKRRWPLVLVGVAAAALLAAVLIVVRDDAKEETIFTDTEEPEPSNSAGQLEPESSIDDSGSATVTFTDFEGATVGSETFSTEIVGTETTPSSIGDLSWTIISGDVPSGDEGGILGTPRGFATVTTDGRLLMSDDAIEWRSVASPFPERVERISEHEGEYYLDTTDNGNQVQWVSNDFVTWSAGGAESSSAASLDVTEWIEGPEFLMMRPHQEYRGSSVTPEGTSLVYDQWNIDWRSLALAAGGADLMDRLDNGEVLGRNSWDPATRIVEITIFESVSARDGFSRGRSSTGPEATGVQFRLSVSGTIDDWTVQFE